MTVAAPVKFPDRTPSFDDRMRADVAAQRGLDRLTADAPPDVRLRAWSAAITGREFVPPRAFQRGRLPRRSSPAPNLRGVPQTIANVPRRTP